MYSHTDWIVEHCIEGSDMKAEQTIIQTENSCDKHNEVHHLFALEYVSDESSKISVIPLACTKCGTMFLTRVQV